MKAAIRHWPRLLVITNGHHSTLQNSIGGPGATLLTIIRHLLQLASVSRRPAAVYAAQDWRQRQYLPLQ